MANGCLFRVSSCLRSAHNHGLVKLRILSSSHHLGIGLSLPSPEALRSFEQSQATEPLDGGLSF